MSSSFRVENVVYHCGFNVLIHHSVVYISCAVEVHLCFVMMIWKIIGFILHCQIIVKNSINYQRDYLFKDKRIPIIVEFLATATRGYGGQKCKIFGKGIDSDGWCNGCWRIQKVSCDGNDGLKFEEVRKIKVQKWQRNISIMTWWR